jgi:hypothetical protein
VYNGLFLNILPNLSTISSSSTSLPGILDVYSSPVYWYPRVSPAFEPLEGDGFILQEQVVFTRIRSGATLVASGGSACGLSISSAASKSNSGWKLG